MFCQGATQSRRGAELLAQRVKPRRMERWRRYASSNRPVAATCPGDWGRACVSQRRSVAGRAALRRARVPTGEIKPWFHQHAGPWHEPARAQCLHPPDKWRYDARLGMPWKTPILRADTTTWRTRRALRGRGTRLGAPSSSQSRFDYETLWRRYVEGECSPWNPAGPRVSWRTMCWG